MSSRSRQFREREREGERMQRSVWVRTFSSPACVHAIESSDDDGSHRSTMAPSGGEESRKKIDNKVTKLLLPLKHRRRISRALRSLSWGAKKEEPTNNKDGGREELSDTETTFVSANSYELRSSSTDVDESEPPSFRLSPPPIFPTGSIERRPPASPVKIVRKLPFGYVIGRQLDIPAPPPPSVTTLARRIKKVVPVMAALHLRSRSQMVKKKVGRALKEACRRGRHEVVEEADVACGSHDDEDVFWKKDVKGLRCRRVDGDDAPY
ncbi:hypothetical protein GQ55_5G300100 [Panicum hallii var. hallii]|uniref:Uncharacterized protein n=1 Tax=Panicum hallii var. hallii TaxID=1504633 RepID=A0A2T7DLI1_9POAL|nr:hypothetical protein GQ55_5G300100 [Panicum hallii var. hallii]